MTDQDWEKWVEKHSSTFGLTSPADVKMLLSWRDVFSLRGYEVDELTEATLWMAGNDPPKFRTEHLAAIHGRINIRRLAVLRAQKQEAMVEACPECGDCAMVVVPHIRFVASGQWLSPWPTFAVCCNCPRGAGRYERLRRIAEESHESRGKKFKLNAPQMSIGDYENQNPRWCEQVREREEAKKVELRAMGHASAVDKQLGRILRNLVRGAEARVEPVKPAPEPPKALPSPAVIEESFDAPTSVCPGPAPF